MKSLNQVNKKLFMLSLVGMLTLGVFSSDANAELKIVKKDINALKTVFMQKGNFTPTDKILDRYGKQAATGRYSNTTPDKMVNWSVEKEYNIVSKESKSIANNITLDGVKIAFPLTFANFGPKYIEFENVDFSKINNTMTPVIIESTKSKMKMVILDTTPLEYNEINSNKYDQKVIEVDMFGGGKHKITLMVDINNKKIVGLNSNTSRFSSERDVKVNGICVGNTFNEMYAKFGTPKIIIINKTKYSVYTIVGYNYLDENGNMWVAFFSNNDKIFINKKYVKTKPNVITEANIICYTANK